MNPDATERTPASPAGSVRPFDWQGRLYVLLILIAGIAAYHNSFTGAFVLDDHHWVTDNPAVRQFPPQREYFVSSPRPILLLSLCFNYWIGKTSVWSYHAFNLVIHILAALVLYGVVRRTLLVPKFHGRFEHRAAPLAFVSALLWLVHPMQTQSITYVVQRCEAMMGLFFLLTLYCVIHGAGSRWRVLWGAAAFVSMVIAIASKEVAVVIPLIVMFYDRIFLTHSLRHMIRSRWALHVALASIWLIPAWIWIWAVPVNAGFGYQGIRPVEYAMTQAGVVLYYLRLAFWPHPLSFDYSDWPRTSTLAAFALPGLGIALLLAATVWAMLKKPALGFLALCFFVILAPSSSIMPIADVAFEQRMYLSLAALIVLVVVAADAALTWLADRAHASAGLRLGGTWVLVGGLAVVLIAATVRRNTDYASEATIWGDVVVHRPSNVRARVTLGTALWRGKQHEPALEQFGEALRLEPRSLFARNGIGLCMMEECRYEDALEYFNAVIAACDVIPFGHTNRGLALYGLGRTEESVESFREAVHLAPKIPGYRFNLALALSDLGKTEEAQKEYREGLRLSPDWPTAVSSQTWQVAVQDDPPRSALMESVRVARQACQATEGKHPDILDALAAVYAQAGRFDEAVATAKQAIELATEDDRPALVRQIRHRLSFYEEGRPYHEAMN
jgi:tetratricopeptide (TPR) repeat protein